MIHHLREKEQESNEQNQKSNSFQKWEKNFGITEIRRFSRDYYQQVYDNKFDNLEVMDHFSKRLKE